jgi:hypothetical protein
MGSPTGDPRLAHILQLKMLEWARAADNDENFIPEAEAEREGTKLIQPKVWHVVKNVMPALTVPRLICANLLSCHG